MGSRSKVRVWVDQAVASQDANHKLDLIARAIYELADFLDDLDNKLAHIQTAVNSLRSR
jgi:hypothetical protein